MFNENQISDKEIQEFFYRRFNAVFLSEDESLTGMYESNNLYPINEFVFMKGLTVNDYKSDEVKELISYIDEFVEDEQEMFERKSFYNSWKEIYAKTPTEIFLERMLHYASTYGIDFDIGGKAYFPISEFIDDDDSENINTTNVEIKIINLISIYDAFKCVNGLLGSNQALSVRDVSIIAAFVKRYFPYAIYDVYASCVNREAKVLLAAFLEADIKDASEFLRLACFYATGHPVLIKSKEVLGLLKRNVRYPKSSHLKKSLEKLMDDELKEWAKSFNRYKDYWLALKKTEDFYSKDILIKTVNRLSKLSKKHHVPLKTSPLSSLSTHRLDASKDLSDDLQQDLYKWLKALNYCHTQLNRSFSKDVSAYVIRNGKVWFDFDDDGADANKTITADAVDIMMRKHNVLFHNKFTLINHLKKHAKHLQGVKVFIPSWVDYGLPISKKQYVGNFPFNTRFTLDDKESESLVCGYYWENKNGIRDLDAAFVDIKGNILNWTVSDSLTQRAYAYSGDVTNAPNGATEFFLQNSKLAEGEDESNLNGYLSASIYSYYHKDDKVLPENMAMFTLLIGKAPADAINSVNKGLLTPENCIMKADIYIDVNQSRFISGYFTKGTFTIGNYATAGKRYQTVQTGDNADKIFESLANKKNLMFSELLTLLDANVIRDKKDVDENTITLYPKDLAIDTLDGLLLKSKGE